MVDVTIVAICRDYATLLKRAYNNYLHNFPCPDSHH